MAIFLVRGSQTNWYKEYKPFSKEIVIEETTDTN